MNNFEYTLPKNAPVTTEELQNDLKQVAEKLNTEIVRENLQTLCLKCNLGKSNLE